MSNKLTDVCSNLFLYLVSFRRQVRNGVNPELSQVRAQILEIFAEQERMVRDDANLARLYEQIKYILYILADEILINSNWTYSNAWQDQLLEWEFFKTRLAGEEFFVRLEKEGERNEALAEIYYLALCLGFTGKYSDDPAKIQDLKWRLYRMLPNRFSEQDTRITPDAYFVGEGAKEAYQPVANLGRIVLVCVVLFLSVFVVSNVVKKRTVRQIGQIVVEMKNEVRPDRDAYNRPATQPERTETETNEDSEE